MAHVDALDALEVNQVFLKNEKAGELGITTERPTFPQDAVVTKRLESFKNWPAYMPIKSDKMVEAGLVYTGVGDSVRCYYCGGGLRNWEVGDNPWEEHAKWYPKCPHVIQVKGQKYIDDVEKGIDPEPECQYLSQHIEVNMDHANTASIKKYSMENLQQAETVHTSFNPEHLHDFGEFLPYPNLIRRNNIFLHDHGDKLLLQNILFYGTEYALCSGTTHGNSISQTAEPSAFLNNGSSHINLPKIGNRRPYSNDYLALLKCSSCDNEFLQSVQYRDFMEAAVFLLSMYAVFVKLMECANYSLQFSPNIDQFWGAADRSGLSAKVLSQEICYLIKKFIHQRNIPTLLEKEAELIELSGEIASATRHNVISKNGDGPNGHDDKKYTTGPKILNACVLCKRCRANILFIPCLHHIICESCRERREIELCPSCQEMIEHFIQTIPA